MTITEISIPAEFEALRDAILNHTPGDAEYDSAASELRAWPRDVQETPPIRIVLGYIRFLDDDNDRARKDFEETYHQSMSRGDWETACWACARMALWHFYTDSNYQEAMNWICRGRDLLVHDDAGQVSSHLGLMEGRLLKVMETDYLRALEVLGEAAMQFRQQGDVDREFWATWFRFEVLPEDKARRAAKILDDLDLEYCSKITIHWN